MSYHDQYDQYRDDTRTGNRRAVREPAGPARVQGGAAAAILVFVALVGFGVGALIGNSSGGDDTTATDDTAGTDEVPIDSPDEQTGDESGDQSSGDQSGDGGTGTEDDGTDGSGDPAPGGSGITLTSPQDGGEVTADSDGMIDVEAVLDSGDEGVTLNPERSLDGGATWEDFCVEYCTDETSGAGKYVSNFWSGREGQNMFRIVGPDGLESNPITVNVVESEGDDEG